MSRYLIASFFGGLIGASCVLIVVYVTNTSALTVSTADVNDAVASLHSRINDFYIFAGIVITLLLAINIGVYVKADEEVDKHLRDNFSKHQRKIESISRKCQKLLSDIETRTD